MQTSALQQMDLLHRNLYERAYADANASSLILHPALFTYASNFEKSLPSKFKRCQAQHLIKDCSKANIVLYGDFHTHRQSQRGIVRLLRDLRDSQPNRNIVIGLECFKEMDTPLIQKFLIGKISESSLLKKSNYSEDWGFPWKNYKMIVDTARELNIKLKGINGPKAGRDSLKLRDRFAARSILEELKHDPSCLVICMIGEYHLADNHLLKELKHLSKNSSFRQPVRVLNNIDKYFFKGTQKNSRLMSSELLNLGKNFYCIMNSPPWIKWRSFAIWEEMRLINDNLSTKQDEEDLIYTEEHFDIDQQFIHLTESLSNFVGIKLSKSARSNFLIEYNLDEHRFFNFSKKDRPPSKEVQASLERMSSDGFHQYNQAHRIIFSDLTLNHMAEACGQFLQCSISQFNDFDIHSGEAFFRRVLKYAAGMLSGKILNPRRKGPNIQEIKQNLNKRIRYRTNKQTSKLQQDIATHVIHINTWLKKIHLRSKNSFQTPQLLFKLDERKSYEISRTLGLMLGEKMYELNIQSKLSSKVLKELFENPLRNQASSFHAFYYFYKGIGGY